MDYFEESLNMHKKYQGKLATNSKVKIENKHDLSLAYSPGVAQPCKEIQKDESKMYDYTLKGNTVAVISDGSAVLGLGNIGAKASLPVMEGKSVLFKEFGNVNSFPIIIENQNTEEFIDKVKQISGGFGGINLEDISSPKCFEIEQRLINELDIPVFHDDQHGTAVVTLAGIINGMKITKKNKEDIKICINGTGASGCAITKLLYKYGFKNITICDSKGVVSNNRTDLTPEKEELLKYTTNNKETLSLKDAIKGKDVFIGVSRGDLLTANDIKQMNNDPLIFTMANPIPEIMPEEAEKGGARIIATGRSDYKNQLNNVLVFPGIFKGALKNKVNDIDDNMKINAAIALSNCVEQPDEESIIPSPFNRKVADVIADNVI